MKVWKESLMITRKQNKVDKIERIIQKKRVINCQLNREKIDLGNLRQKPLFLPP